MSFNWPKGGGSFVTKEEKQALAESGTPIEVTDVREEEGQYGARFVVECLIPDPVSGEPQEKLLPFQKGSVGSRDSALLAAKRAIDAGEEIPSAKLTKAGRSYLLVPIDAD